MDELTINGELYIRKSIVDGNLKTIDLALYYLEKLMEENPKQEVIVELPNNKGCAFKLKDCFLYEAMDGCLVFDGE